MKREELRKLGLTDEQVDAVMASHGVTIKTFKDKLTETETIVENQKEQLASLDKSLNQLKKDNSDNDALKEQVDALKQANKELEKASDERITQLQRDTALNQLLGEFKVKNAKAVNALLDDELIKFDSGELKGVKEQLEALKESDAYLFDLGTTLGGYSPKAGQQSKINQFEAPKLNEFRITK